MRTLVILVLCFVACAGAAGQDSQIFGLIRDPSSASVDGAEITLRNEQTGGVRNTKSNESGSYSLPALQPGGYRLTVRAAGFQTIVREGIQLNVGENARVDFALSIGSAQTTITVHDDHPLVNTTDASIGTVIDRNLIDQMPLNGRGIQTLIELSPGVNVVAVFDASRGQFVVNGQRSDANYFTVDGVSANFAVANSQTLDNAHSGLRTAGQAGGGMLPGNNFLGTFSNLLSPEALQEFKIQTSTYTPEFGHLPGAQIGLISRSGSTRYSGSLFEYFRSNTIDANDWFNNAQGIPNPGLHFDNFGGTFGGPLRLPRHSRVKDRTFFFLSVDVMTIHQSQQANTILVPTLSARRNAPPALAAVLNAYPLPLSDVGPGGNSSTSGFVPFVGASTLKYEQRTYAFRVDHNFSDKLRLFLRFSHAPSERAQPIPSFVGTPSNIERYTIGTNSITAGLTQSISANLVNEVRLNVSRQSASDATDVDGAFGAIRPEISQFLPAGYSAANSNVELGFGAQEPAIKLGMISKNEARQMEAVDTLSYSLGPHLLKFGVDYRRFSPIQIVPAYSTDLTFDGIFTTAGSYISTISKIANSVSSSSKTAYVIPQFSAFAQDTWRLTPRFTINYGLRWEVAPAPRVSAGQALVEGGLTNLNDASNAYLLPAGQPFYPTTYGNIAPRVGTAWQFFSRGQWMSVFRAGAGVFFGSAQGGFEDTPVNPTVLSIFTNQPLDSLGTGTPSQVLDLPSGATTVFGVAAAPHYKLPVVYQWNVTFEQAVGKQTFSAGYVGSVGRRLIGSISLLSLFAPFSVLGNDSSSSYNALQLQFNRRLSHRLQILTSYTFSHSIDNLSTEVPPLSIDRFLSQYLHPDGDRGSSDFDIRHSLNGAVIAELPAPHSGLAARFLRNWSANAIFFARSALPSDISDPFSLGLRPDVVPGQPLYLYGSQYPGGKSYNYAAFTHAPVLVEGNFGRNVLRGFGAWQLDFAMHRKFEFSEKASLEFRAEAFNILNHPNFANPNNFFDPTTILLLQIPQVLPPWGQSSAMLASGLGPSLIPGELNPLFQIGGPRTLQFALRLRF